MIINVNIELSMMFSSANKTSFKIYLGLTNISNFNPNEHPYYERVDYLLISGDLLRIKINRTVVKSEEYLSENSICLPMFWTSLVDKDCHFRPTPGCEPTEYAMMATWGEDGSLERTYWRLFNTRYSNKHQFHREEGTWWKDWSPTVGQSDHL